MVIKVPGFKAHLTSVGNSEAFIVPAPYREAHNIEKEKKYLVEMRLTEVPE